MNSEQSQRYFQLMADGIARKHQVELQQKRQEWNEKRDVLKRLDRIEVKLEQLLRDKK